MGSALVAPLAQAADTEAWARIGRGPKLRKLFGAYRGQDCWGVVRKFRHIDDGNGYVSYEELQQIVYLPDHHLLFVWDLFAQQNTLLDYRELLTAVCLFSSAQLEEKARFLVSLFDDTQTGRCTGEEMAKLCVMTLSVLQKCTGGTVKAKEVSSHLKAELPELVPEYASQVAYHGTSHAFGRVRMFGNAELGRMLPSVRAAYEALPLCGPRPADAAPPPPESWAQQYAPKASGKAEVRPAKTGSTARAPGSTAGSFAPGLRASAGGGSQQRGGELAHLSWMRKMEVTAASDDRESSRVANAPASAHTWMVIYKKDFPSIAKDIEGFQHLFAKSISHSLGLPCRCIEVVNVTSGGGGGIVAEFIMRPSGRDSDTRSASALLLVLEGQLGNPHSALRKSPLGPYLEQAELLAGEPRRAATPPCREGGAAPERCDQGAQAVAEEPAALRPAKKKAKGKAAVSNPDALEEGEETQMLRKIREANTELFSTRQRAEEAEAAEQSLLEELQRLDAELAGLVVPVLPAEGLPEGESLGLAYPVDEVLPAEGLPEGESLGLAYPVDDDLGLDGQQPLL